jgi:hypothetical protein
MNRRTKPGCRFSGKRSQPPGSWILSLSHAPTSVSNWRSFSERTAAYDPTANDIEVRLTEVIE